MKNVALYTLQEEELHVAKGLLTEELLSEHRFKPLGDHDSRRIGFVENLDTLLVSHTSSGVLLKIMEQVKKVEPNEVHTRLCKRKDDLKTNEDIDASKKQISSWKSEIIAELLPNTFPKVPSVYSVFIRKDGLVLVEGNHKKSEECISVLRTALGTFPCKPLETDIPVSDLLDSLLMPQSTNKKEDEGFVHGVEFVKDEKFTLGNKVILFSEEGRKITIDKESVYASEAQDLVINGCMVVQLSLCYDGVVSFQLKDDLTLSSIKYSSDLTSDSTEDAYGTELLCLEEVNNIIDDIIGRLIKEG